MTMLWYGILAILLLAIVIRAGLSSGTQHKVVVAMGSAIVLINLFYATELPNIYFGILNTLVHLKIFPLLLLAGIYLAGFHTACRDHPRIRWWWQRVATVSAVGLAWGLLSAGYTSCKTHLQCRLSLPSRTEHADGLIDSQPLIVTKTGSYAVQVTPAGSREVRFEGIPWGLLGLSTVDNSPTCIKVTDGAGEWMWCPGQPFPRIIRPKIVMYAMGQEPRVIIVQVHNPRIASGEVPAPQRRHAPEASQSQPVIHPEPVDSDASVKIFPAGETVAYMWPSSQLGCIANAGPFQAVVKGTKRKAVWSTVQGTEWEEGDSTVQLVAHAPGVYWMVATIAGTEIRDTVTVKVAGRC